MTTFNFVFTFRWQESRESVLESGFKFNDDWDWNDAVTNKTLLKFLRRYTLRLGHNAVPDDAQAKLRITMQKRKAKR